jgi:hypothetical protein
MLVKNGLLRNLVKNSLLRVHGQHGHQTSIHVYTFYGDILRIECENQCRKPHTI